MTPTDAALAVGHDYPGGCASLAPRMGMPVALLRAKLNPHDKRQHLTLAESTRMQMLSSDHRILFAMAEELGYMCMPAPIEDGESGGRHEAVGPSSAIPV